MYYQKNIKKKLFVLEIDNQSYEASIKIQKIIITILIIG